ncbi:MAG: MFS transporter [Bacteroidia bacterium]|nr:MFS transporter [Bacteroidia bacterium]MBT8276393.1 MFS transporter [Bacteroidia bacterium]NNF30317.1 MFS transporter [Flavobacteriaceae bacterium]NNK53538.1 MFS transporter [Flavobacteriaceae bacterium]NNM08678.1 MFS transporter [Flavobacteriaceae bacterium]
MKKLFNSYINNFTGLTREIWLLSLVTFINRAGAMVIPFLSLYLVKAKGFTLPEVGWIMSCYGVGSLAGTYVGGWLTDRMGFHKVIVLSLFLGGLGFIGIQFLDTFHAVCAGIFIAIFLVDSYRPAIFVACDAYSKPENVTRSIALIRLAINLGFSIGPVLGGLIIARINYSALFWIDGVTCVIAAFLLYIVLKPKKVNKDRDEEEALKEGLPPFKNFAYMIFFLIMVANGIMFIQYFSVMPLYYKDVHFLSEDLIGALLFINGAVIVLLEMPLVGWLERIQISRTIATFWGVVFLALSFIVLNMSGWTGVLIIGMLLMTLGEMIGSPFANALALSMSPKGRKGSYMGVFSMSFSLSHIIGHNSGMNLVNSFGYDTTWNIMFYVLLGVALLTLFLYRFLKKSPNFTTY